VGKKDSLRYITVAPLRLQGDQHILFPSGPLEAASTSRVPHHASSLTMLILMPPSRHGPRTAPSVYRSSTTVDGSMHTGYDSLFNTPLSIVDD
jgi:hypothetical protein